jgi:predicted transcriptional regulator
MIDVEITPKSSRIINSFAFMLENGSAFAHQLAQIMNIDSRETYPILKTWILKGVVTVVKHGRRNVYSISQKFKILIKNTVKRYSYKGRDFIIAKAKERYKRFLGREPDPEVLTVIEYFVDKTLSGNPYIQGSQNESVAELLARVLNISLYEINEILRELVQANILYVWKNRKARLDSSLTA